MNKKQFWIVVLIIIILVAIIAWWSTRLFSSPSGPSIVLINTTSTSQTTTTSQSTTSSSPATWGQYDINAPDALMLVDSQGHRTGENPITGVFYREIPNTAYSVGASASGHPVGELTFSDLPSGQYTLYVLGGVTGSYGIGINNNHGQQSFQGNIQAGAMVAYIQTYDPANLASSGFAVSSTASSTASITTAPPNNWTSPVP